jgi:beta-N-acetylhexosaminidase
VIAGFGGVTLPPEIRMIAREFDLGGVILFARNVEAPEQVADLAREVQGLRQDLPLWVSVDQEGGRVARLKAPFTEWPPMITLGRSGDDQLAERFARALAAELAAVGITLDFAPVLDVHTNPRNPVIGDRALAERAETVARLGCIIIETLQANGVAACGKHFPGHGDTSTDSHHDLPVVEHPPDRLRAVELLPFAAAIEAGVASVMTGHVLVPSLDEEHPATLSGAIVRTLLRSEMGFDGVVFTDDMDMGAIARRYTAVEAAVAAVGAGCDGLLLCGPDPDRQVAALEALVHAVEQEQLPARDVEDAIARHRRMKERFLFAGGAGTRGGPRDRRFAIGREEHQLVAAEMSRHL